MFVDSELLDCPLRPAAHGSGSEDMNCCMRRREVPAKKSNTIRMRHKRSCGTVLSRGFAILIAIFFATNLAASAQSALPGLTDEAGQSTALNQPDKSLHPSSSLPLTALKPQMPEAAYRPITVRERLSWFTSSTIGLPHRAGGIFVSGFGTALDRPKE